MIVETKPRPSPLRSRCSRLLSGHLNRAQYLQQTLDSITRHSPLNAFIAAHTSVEQLAINSLTGPLAGAREERPGEPSAGKLRIGVPRAHFYDDLHPEIAVAMEKTLGQLRSAGMILVEADVEGIAELNPQVGFPIAFYDMLREIAVFTAREGFDLSIHALEQGIVGAAEKQAIQAQLREAAIPHSRYVTAIRDHLPQYIARMDRYFAEHSIDLLVVPTVPLPAVPARPQGEDLFMQHNGRQELMFTAYIRNTEPLSNYGGPCLTVPVATTADGRPIGMELAGRRRADRRLLITANQLQTLLRDAV